ncbi:MAG: pyridoxal 5'-phosphate synthase glutaminase subunit PdxT [Dehalococcoidia bacterium]|nr:MAG: pyridoxal 5'-phosphate synthase glutaminase subunit PdxT [Dehalococcoidia bacterium]
MKTGILALQGDFIEHCGIIEKLDANPLEVRLPEHLKGLSSLIIPGGESTTILNLLHYYNLFHPIRKLANLGLPIMGTCAGMVLLAKKVLNPDMETLALMDIEVRRNAFGRQIDSFENFIDVPFLRDGPFPAVFIRAPLIEHTSSNVDILGRLPDGRIVAARQGNILAFSFHPELNSDTRIHRYFLETTVFYKSEKAE